MYAHDNAQTTFVNKGKIGETIFENWCIKHQKDWRKSTTKEDYEEKWDYKVDGRKIAVKNNYNKHYNTIIVELQQLTDGPAPWIDSDVDDIAFIIDYEVVIIPRLRLKEICQNNHFKTFDREQWKTKGSYRIMFVPLDIIRKG